MANIHSINTNLKIIFPDLDVEVVRGDGYVYFDGDDGYDKVDSVMVDPSSVTTGELLRIVVEEIADEVGKSGFETVVKSWQQRPYTDTHEAAYWLPQSEGRLYCRAFFTVGTNKVQQVRIGTRKVTGPLAEAIASYILMYIEAAK